MIIYNSLLYTFLNISLLFLYGFHFTSFDYLSIYISKYSIFLSSNFNTSNTAHSNQDGGLVDIEGFAMKSSMKNNINSSSSSSSNGNYNNSSNDNSNNNSHISRNDSGGGGTIPNSRTSYSVYDEPVTRSRLLVVFNVISLFASVVGALFSFFQAITLFLVFPILLNDPIYLVLTMYQIVFGIAIVLVEMVILLVLVYFMFLLLLSFSTLLMKIRPLLLLLFLIGPCYNSV